MSQKQAHICLTDEVRRICAYLWIMHSVERKLYKRKKICENSTQSDIILFFLCFWPDVWFKSLIVTKISSIVNDDIWSKNFFSEVENKMLSFMDVREKWIIKTVAYYETSIHSYTEDKCQCQLSIDNTVSGLNTLALHCVLCGLTPS